MRSRRPQAGGSRSPRTRRPRTGPRSAGRSATTPAATTRCATGGPRTTWSRSTSSRPTAPVSPRPTVVCAPPIRTTCTPSDAPVSCWGSWSSSAGRTWRPSGSSSDASSGRSLAITCRTCCPSTGWTSPARSWARRAPAPWWSGPACAWCPDRPARCSCAWATTTSWMPPATSPRSSSSPQRRWRAPTPRSWRPCGRAAVRTLFWDCPTAAPGCSWTWTVKTRPPSRARPSGCWSGWRATAGSWRARPSRTRRSAPPCGASARMGRGCPRAWPAAASPGRAGRTRPWPRRTWPTTWPSCGC